MKPTAQQVEAAMETLLAAGHGDRTRAAGVLCLSIMEESGCDLFATGLDTDEFGRFDLVAGRGVAAGWLAEAKQEIGKKLDKHVSVDGDSEFFPIRDRR